MILLTTHTNPRLAYMAHWLGMRLFNTPLKIECNKENLPPLEWVLNYTNEELQSHPSIWIKPHCLLFENTITPQKISVSSKDEVPYFFETAGDFHFDILAATFYLIQRYEEYLPHTKDIYGRYAHENSLAYKNNFLNLPLVDIWLQELKKTITNSDVDKAAEDFAKTTLSYLPTYDIDIAYCYKGKGFIRNIAGILKSFFNFKLIVERWMVITNKMPDPFDVYEELDVLHSQFNLQPVYFFLMANTSKGYDKNIHPAKQEMKNLVRNIGTKFNIGIHPTWQSGDDKKLLPSEIAMLKTNSLKSIYQSRQHYIRMAMPESYKALLLNGITEDYSMGYGSINGFRASTSVPYYWYNLADEQTTGLKIFPFCYMEANSIFEQKNTPAQALEELKQFEIEVKITGGTLITIFHNHLIGRDLTGRKWMAVYKDFLNYLYS